MNHPQPLSPSTTTATMATTTVPSHLHLDLHPLYDHAWLWLHIRMRERTSPNELKEYQIAYESDEKTGWRPITTITSTHIKPTHTTQNQRQPRRSTKRSRSLSPNHRIRVEEESVTLDTITTTDTITVTPTTPQSHPLFNMDPTNTAPFTCERCHRHFVRASGFERHQMVCTGEASDDTAFLDRDDEEEDEAMYEEDELNRGGDDYEASEGKSIETASDGENDVQSPSPKRRKAGHSGRRKSRGVKFADCPYCHLTLFSRTRYYVHKRNCSERPSDASGSDSSSSMRRVSTTKKAISNLRH